MTTPDDSRVPFDAADAVFRSVDPNAAELLWIDIYEGPDGPLIARYDAETDTWWPQR